jgi:divalent metal cation (Fe/Co/Zn/Cd) transporter
MPLLSWCKRVTGLPLGNPVLHKESYVTLIGVPLAAAVLLGLILNSLFDWWWADLLAGLVIDYYGLREGRPAWHGDG